MTSKMKMTFVLAAFSAAAALTASPALAADAETEMLGAKVAHSLTTAVDLKAVMMAKTSDLGSVFSSIKNRPEWPEMFRQALAEELDADAPILDQIIGHALATQFSKAELQAGTELFDGPAHADVVKLVQTGARGGKPDDLSPALKQAFIKLYKQPGGKGFVEKFGHLDTLIDSAGDDLAATLVAGVFRRFGEKAEAGERARRAALN